jgi:hypothetical protein
LAAVLKNPITWLTPGRPGISSLFGHCWPVHYYRLTLSKYDTARYIKET